MNELAHLIKSLAYSLTVVSVSDKCVSALAQHHEYKHELERLQRGLERQRSEGYDLETKQVPTESTCIMVLDRIQSHQYKITELQQQCSLLTPLEKNTLLALIGRVLDAMEQRACAAQTILETMAKQGLDIEDIR